MTAASIRTSSRQHTAFPPVFGATIIWLVAGIHETTVRACPTMDSACQINQESPE